MHDGLDSEYSLGAMVVHIILSNELFMPKYLSWKDCADFVKDLLLDLSFLPLIMADWVDILALDLNKCLYRELSRLEDVDLIHIVTDVIHNLIVVADYLLQDVVKLNCLGIGPVLLYKFHPEQEIKPLSFLAHLKVIHSVLVLGLSEYEA